MTPIPEPTPRRDRNVSPAVKGTVQFTFDVLELFLDARYDTALIGLDTARQIVKQTSVLKTGLDLVGLAIDRQYAFERDVLVRARRAVDPNDVSFAGAGLIRRPSSA